MGPAGFETVDQAAVIRLRWHSADTVCEPAARLADGDEVADAIRSQVKTARATQAGWSGRSVRDRRKILTKLRLKIAGDPRALADTVERESPAETLAAEVLPLLDACRFLEAEAPRILQEKLVGNRARPMWLWGNSVVLRPEPLGVVLIIGPSNYPLMLPGIQALQAIVSGNVVLIKPAVNCSRSVEALVSLATSAGLPEGLIQVLPESSEAAALAIRIGVDKVFLTGSTATGRAVSRELAESTTPSVMELSGCDAVFILEGADPHLVSDSLLFGLTLNGSRTCMAPRRVFARNEQVDEIVRLLKVKLEARERIRNVEFNGRRRTEGSQGSPGAAVLRSPATATATPQAGIASQKIREAIADGAELVCGSLTNGAVSGLSGVAILDHVTSDMSVAQSDMFAPVLSFIRVESEVQALQENARCPYALSATVFGSTARCHEFARRIDAGCVVINDMIVPSADPRVPFGGRRMSGHGMTRGEAGLLEMTQQKAIVAPRRWFRPHLQQPTAADGDVLEQLIRLEHAGNPLQALIAVPKIIRATIEQMKLRRVHRHREDPDGDRRATMCPSALPRENDTRIQ